MTSNIQINLNQTISLRSVFCTTVKDQNKLYGNEVVGIKPIVNKILM